MGDDSAHAPDVADLALLNEDNAIRIMVNGRENFVAKEWLEGDGRAANSIFSKQILGTPEGLQGSIELTIEEDCMSVFDMMLLWLLVGDGHIQSCLTEENASELFQLAEYFALEELKAAILREQNKREEEEAKRVAAAEAERQAAAAEASRRAARLLSEWRSGTVRCSTCGDATTVAPNYRGNTPRCGDCRNIENEDYDDRHDDFDDYGGYSSDDYW